jgi:hypothetical protein
MPYMGPWAGLLGLTGCWITTTENEPSVRDHDGDGYDADDCDDLRPEIHPNADEACNAVDDDCDGLIDCIGECHPEGLPWTCALVDLAVDGTLIDGGPRRRSSFVAGDMDGDDRGDLWIGAYHPEENATDVIATVKLYRGPWADPPNPSAIITSVLTFDAGELTGDGNMDLAVAGTLACPAGILPGPLEGTVDAADCIPIGVDPDVAPSTYGISAPGDLTGDGVEDVLVDVSQGSQDSQRVGAYVVSGPIPSEGADSSDAVAFLSGNVPYDMTIGLTHDAIDLDDDGALDLVFSDSSSLTAGVYFGPLEGERADPDRMLWLDPMGQVLVGEDVDLDGSTDLIVANTANAYKAAPNKRQGVVWVLLGPITEDRTEADIAIVTDMDIDGWPLVGRSVAIVPGADEPFDLVVSVELPGLGTELPVQMDAPWIPGPLEPGAYRIEDQTHRLWIPSDDVDNDLMGVPDLTGDGFGDLIVETWTGATNQVLLFPGPLGQEEGR